MSIKDILAPLTSQELYEKLKGEDLIVGSHESDLYALVTSKSISLIQRYQYKSHVTRFIDNIEQRLCFDIPFANQEFWDEVERKARRQRNLEKEKQSQTKTS